jgi:hypothetical protein
MSPADADLLLDYLGGRLTDREIVRVQARLRLEPSLADALVRLARDEAAMSEWVLGQLASPPVLPPTPPARWPLVGWASVAAAVLVGGLSIFLASRKPPIYVEEGTTTLTPGAKVVAVRGDANLVTSDGLVPVTVGQVIRPGDRLKTGADGEAVVTLPDDGRVELRSGTEAQIMPPDSNSRVDVRNGSVRTEVSRADPMTVSTPHAFIRAAAALTCVATTETTVTAEAEQLRMTRRSDNSSVDVREGGTVSTGPETDPMVPVVPSRTIRVPAAAATQVAVSATGLLAIGTSDARVTLRPLAGDDPAASYRFRGHRLATAGFSADGKWVALADDQIAEVRDARTGHLRWAAPAQRTEVRAVALSPDGTRLVVGGRLSRGQGEVRVYDIETGTELAVLKVGGGVNAIAFAPNGRVLAIAATDSTVRLWDAATWRPKGEPLSLPGEARALAFSPDGNILAVGGRDGFLKLVQPGEPDRALEGPSANVDAIAFSPDGTALAAAVGDSVWVWSPADGRPRRTIAAHRDRVNSVAYSPDGKSLVSAGGDGTVKVWDVD